MALISTPALILSTMKYRESSVIFKAFTLEKGKVDFIISGVRKKNSKVAMSLLQPSFFVDLTAYYKEGETLNRVKEIKAKILYKSIPFHIINRSIALFSTELLNNIITLNQDSRTLFNFLVEYFQYIDHEPDIINTPLFLLKEMWQHLGIFPNVNSINKNSTVFNIPEGAFLENRTAQGQYIDGARMKHFYEVLFLNYDNLKTYHIGYTDRKKLIGDIMNYYQYHVSQFKKLRSLPVLEEVLAP